MLVARRIRIERDVYERGSLGLGVSGTIGFEGRDRAIEWQKARQRIAAVVEIIQLLPPRENTCSQTDVDRSRYHRKVST